tara:strand:+ start:1355 stop:1861 length:507 start_codon:yes stop_codon:yes gene_type:complete
MNSELIQFLPDEIKQHILGYYPIIDNDRKLINVGIKNVYCIHRLIQLYGIYHFHIPGDTNLYAPNYLNELSASWVYSDLCFFLNELKPLKLVLSNNFINFLSRLPYPYDDMVSLLDLSFLEDSYPNDELILVLFASYMTKIELDSFINYVNEVYDLSSITKNIDIFNK